MTRTSNVQIVMSDDEGLFIRVGTVKYRPPQEARGGALRGKTVRAWPWTGGMKVEADGTQIIWPRA